MGPLRFAIAASLALATPASAASIVTDWLDVALPIVEDVAPYPTTSARLTAVLHTAIYDAWSAFDDRAVATTTGDMRRGEGGSASIAGKREAISHAARTVLVAAAPHRERAVDRFMTELGYAPDADTPAARLGRDAADAVLDARRLDGANEADGFSDGGLYAPRGTPNAWEPLMSEGEPQMAITPHWGSVVPFALPGADALRPPAPPEPGSPAFAAQIEDVLAMSAELTDEHKAIAEYWVPWVSHPASHLMQLTRDVSFDRRLGLDEDVALFFTVSVALLDASVASWDAKYHYDYVRPETAIRALGDRIVTAWASPSARAGMHLPNMGRAMAWGRSEAAVEMPARQWRPYIPTPPFPEYVSGHSAFTAAWARAVELALGDTRFGHETLINRLYVENRKLPEPITLRFETFWEAAVSSGESRLYGGVHWPVGNEEGLALGRAAGEMAWREARRHLDGRARPVGAMLALDRSVWSTRSTTRGTERAAFQAREGLSMGGLGMVAPADPIPTMTYGGRWVSHALDPLPAGEWTMDVRMEIVDADVTLVVDAGMGAARMSGPGSLHFSSDGRTPLRLSFEALVAGREHAEAWLNALALSRRAGE